MADNTAPKQQPDVAKQSDAHKSRAEAPKDDEPQFFQTSIAKMVERENEDGEKEWVEVVSDNLYPGEKLKRDYEEEMAEKKAKEDADAADKK